MSGLDDEVVVDWSGAVMLGVIKMSNSTISTAGEYAYLEEFVGEMCCIGTPIGFLL